MGLSHDDQFQKIIEGSEHLLIVLPENPTGDMIGAGYGLAHFAAEMNIICTLAYKNTSGVREMYDFLPVPDGTVHTLTGTRDFVLTFHTKHNAITDVKTVRTDESVEVRITPERGMIDTRDFSFGLADFPYSVMIAIGAQSKEDFGALLKEIPDIFYDVPIINIDRAAANEQFGQLNIVTLTASSLAEIVTSLCEHIAPEHLTSDVAKCFLTGIISATDSFRAPSTTPRALSLASTLIDYGADQQDIVNHLYKSQPLSLITLWGRTLSKLVVHAHGDIISTLITQEDFSSTETDTHYLPLIIEKIKKNHTTAKFFIIIYEADDATEKTCKALIDASRHGDLPEEVFGPREESGFYETTFKDGDCNTGREKIAELIERAISTSKK